jgi:hypothetical protein
MDDMSALTVPPTELEISEVISLGEPVAMTVRRLAFERDKLKTNNRSLMDNLHATAVELAAAEKRLDAAAKYIQTLRQIVYADRPEVLKAAWERVNSEGSEFHALCELRKLSIAQHEATIDASGWPVNKPEKCECGGEIVHSSFRGTFCTRCSKFDR